MRHADRRSCYKNTCTHALEKREQINPLILNNNTSVVWAPVLSVSSGSDKVSFLSCMTDFTSNHTFMLCPDQESLRLGILTSGREFFLFDIGQGSYSEKKKKIIIIPP